MSNNDIISDLCRMGQDVSSTCESIVVKLQDIVIGTRGLEISDDILAEGSTREHERIGAAPAGEEIVACAASDGVVTFSAVNRSPAGSNIATRKRVGS